MKVFFAADHRGWELKAYLIAKLSEGNYEIEDAGAFAYNEDDDYPDFGEKAAQGVAADPLNNRGIFICGSGVGMAIAANKIAGVRCSLIHDENMLRAARRDDDLNALALGADFIAKEEALRLVMIFLREPFSGSPRYERRIEKIKDIEDRCCK